MHLQEQKPPKVNPQSGRPVRLAIVVTHPITAERLMLGQLSYLRGHGFDILLISAPGPGLEAVATREKIDTLAIPMEREISPLSDLRSLIRLIQALRRWRPDVINASTPKAGLLGSLAAWFCRVPLRFYTLRGLRLETSRGLKRQLLSLSERLASAAAHRVICVSPSLLRRYLDLNLARPGKLRVLGAGGSNGVDTERFARLRQDDQAKETLAAELGLPGGAPVIGYAGRWTRDKGLPELLAAFEELQKEIPELRLLALGEFEAGDPVAPDIARRWESNASILRPGFVPDTGPYYPLMQVLAFPSHREGLPNVPLEAAAASLPVVGFAVTGTVDAVEEGVTGALVPPGDATALAAALRRYLRHPELAESHGEAGRRRVESLFGNATVWRHWRDAYRGQGNTATGSGSGS